MEENQNLERPAEPSKGKATGAKNTEPKQKKSAVGTVLMVLSIIILIGVVGFLLFRDQQKTEVIQAKQNRIDTDSIKIAQQMEELNVMQTQLELWKSKADSLQMDKDSLQALIVDIETLRRELRSSNRRASNFQAEVSRIKSEVTSREDQLKQLTLEKEAALAKIDTLNTQQRVLNDTISKITQERSDLKEKVQLASILRGEELMLTGITSKGKEVPGPLFKNKSLAKLKITYFIGENKVAPQTSKKIVIRLVEPDGTVLFSGTDGGSFKTAEGDEKMYTMTQDIQFSGGRQKGSFLYQKGNEYKSGKHIVELYADGHKIGETSFMVK